MCSVFVKQFGMGVFMKRKCGFEELFLFIYDWMYLILWYCGLGYMRFYGY